LGLTWAKFNFPFISNCWAYLLFPLFCFCWAWIYSVSPFILRIGPILIFSSLFSLIGPRSADIYSLGPPSVSWFQSRPLDGHLDSCRWDKSFALISDPCFHALHWITLRFTHILQISCLVIPLLSLPIVSEIRARAVIQHFCWLAGDRRTPLGSPGCQEFDCNLGFLIGTVG
jgi:hypothetical protein